MTNQNEAKNDVCNDHVGHVPYKICEKFDVENFTMVVRVEFDIEDLDVKVGWSHDSPVNVTTFTSAIGATSTVPEDRIFRDYHQRNEPLCETMYFKMIQLSVFHL